MNPRHEPLLSVSPSMLPELTPKPPSLLLRRSLPPMLPPLLLPPPPVPPSQSRAPPLPSPARCCGTPRAVRVRRAVSVRTPRSRAPRPRPSLAVRLHSPRGSGAPPLPYARGAAWVPRRRDARQRAGRALAARVHRRASCWWRSRQPPLSPAARRTLAPAALLPPPPSCAALARAPLAGQVSRLVYSPPPVTRAKTTASVLPTRPRRRSACRVPPRRVPPAPHPRRPPVHASVPERRRAEHPRCKRAQGASLLVAKVPACSPAQTRVSPACRTQRRRQSTRKLWH